MHFHAFSRSIWKFQWKKPGKMAKWLGLQVELPPLPGSRKSETRRIKRSGFGVSTNRWPTALWSDPWLWTYHHSPGENMAKPWQNHGKIRKLGSQTSWNFQWIFQLMPGQCRPRIVANLLDSLPSHEANDRVGFCWLVPLFHWWADSLKNHDTVVAFRFETSTFPLLHFYPRLEKGLS